MSLDLVRATLNELSTAQLLSYAEDDLRAIRYRIETGRDYYADTGHWPQGSGASARLAVYASELERRGY